MGSSCYVSHHFCRAFSLALTEEVVRPLRHLCENQAKTRKNVSNLTVIAAVGVYPYLLRVGQKFLGGSFTVASSTLARAMPPVKRGDTERVHVLSSHAFRFPK